MDKKQFQNRLCDYIGGTLNEEETRGVEAYLAAHPEAQAEVAEMRETLSLLGQIKATTEPDGLYAQARAAILERTTIRARPHVYFLRQWLRPAYAASLAVVITIAVIGILWSRNTNPVWADVVAEIGQLQSVHVEGWIRGEEGQQVAVSQWLRAPNNYRAEVGTGNAQRVVLIDSVRRLVRDERGIWREETLAEGRDWSIERVVEQLRLPADSTKHHWIHRIEREQRAGHTVFTVWPRRFMSKDDKTTPGYMKFEVELGSSQYLPYHTRAFVHKEKDSWQQVSEFSYRDFNAPLSDSLFAQPPLTLRQPMDHPAEDALWFERALTPIVAWGRTLYMPLRGLEITEIPQQFGLVSMGSGYSHNIRHGVDHLSVTKQSLAEIIRSIGNMPVELADSTAPQKIYALHIAVRGTMPSRMRTERLCSALQVDCTFERRQAQRTRYIFTYDGRDFAIAQGSGSASSSSSDYDGRAIPLEQALRGILVNSGMNGFIKGYNRDLNTIEMSWDGAKNENPFAKKVDVKISLNEGWTNTARYLREAFGVEMYTAREEIAYEVVVVGPAQNATEER